MSRIVQRVCGEQSGAGWDLGSLRWRAEPGSLRSWHLRFQRSFSLALRDRARQHWHEISELLWQLDEPHAVIDLDELGHGVIPEGSDDFNLALTVDNMKAVWSNSRATGVRRLALARVVRTREDLQQLCDAIPDL